MITAKVVLDSIRKPASMGQRITTLQLTYPRFIHSEFMTHRVFSRNASSSRAIPVAKMLKMVEEDPATTIFWGKNEKGMQSWEELGESDRLQATGVWRQAAVDASRHAQALMKLGVHKQFANRLLEPFQHISVVVTSTEWSNFFELRDHPEAEPNFQALAKAMRKALDESVPQELEYGEWHLPYVWQGNANPKELGLAINCSSARCARVSYLTHDGENPNPDEDQKLFERLVGSKPFHASPTEHQAVAMSAGKELTGNFGHGWVQHRKLLEHGHDPVVFTRARTSTKL